LIGLRETDTPYAVIENRETAIAFTIQSAQKGDVILLAGKGHETYQVLQVGKIPFDERKITAEWLSRADQLRPINGG
jgi:UDP-N-acetylmuramoyl-L-alanyl-D-glutamate--2,6-diaminopimelate ligase